MKNSKRWMMTGVCVAGLAAIAGSVVLADPKADAPAGMPEMQLPKGWTPEDMQACMQAGTPGKEHAMLAKLAGTWTSNEKMRMGPDMPEMPSTGTWTMTSILDGRYVQLDAAGEIPGMGPYKGLGLMGFDNVSKKYVATYIDQMSTGMMNGVGEMSADGKVLTINYSFNCPITKKASNFREVLKFESEGKMHVEMFMTDPKSGKEYTCMQAELTRKS